MYRLYIDGLIILGSTRNLLLLYDITQAVESTVYNSEQTNLRHALFSAGLITVKRVGPRLNDGFRADASRWRDVTTRGILSLNVKRCWRTRLCGVVIHPSLHNPVCSSPSPPVSPVLLFIPSNPDVGDATAVWHPCGCKKPNDDRMWLRLSRSSMGDEHFRMPALMPGTHCQNICDKPFQSTFSSAL